MATKTSQRVFIWVIAIALTVGTITGFIAMMIAPGNQKLDQERYQAMVSEYSDAYKAYEAKMKKQQDYVSEHTEEWSEKYYKQFSGYKELVKSFKKDDVKKLQTRDLSEGSGKAIDEDSTFIAYYIGWNPEGKIFDGSIEKATLKQPLIVRPQGVIPGWTEGLKGMEIGGVRLLTIPADKAYGAAGQGSDIPPNTPLKFVVMPIEMIDTINPPEVPQELMEAYGRQ